MNSIFVGVKFVLGILSVKIVSVFLGPSGMAITSHLRDFSTMFKSFSSLGINNAVIKTFKDNTQDKEKKSRTLSSFFWSYVVVSVSISIILILCSKPLNLFLFGHYDYHLIIKLIGLLLPLYFINLFLKALLNSVELFKSIIWIQIIAAISTFIFTTLLIYYKGILGALFAISIIDLVVLIITIILIKKHWSLFDFKLIKGIKREDLKILEKYALMALITAIVVPLTAILIRSNIISEESEFRAGIWDSSKRISSFYMMFITSGLALYYVPKIATIKTNISLKLEIKKYYKTLMPVFLLALILVYFLKDIIIKIALTPEFFEVKKLLIWQMIGDFVKVATLAFGFVLSVRAMLLKYIAIELIFNVSYLVLAKLLLKTYSIEGVVFSYMVANIISLLIIIWFFRKLIFSRVD